MVENSKNNVSTRQSDLNWNDPREGQSQDIIFIISY